MKRTNTPGQGPPPASGKWLNRALGVVVVFVLMAAGALLSAMYDRAHAHVEHHEKGVGDEHRLPGKDHHHGHGHEKHHGDEDHGIEVAEGEREVQHLANLHKLAGLDLAGLKAGAFNIHHGAKKLNEEEHLDQEKHNYHDHDHEAATKAAGHEGGGDLHHDLKKDIAQDDHLKADTPQPPLDLSLDSFDEDNEDTDAAILEFAKLRSYKGTLMLIPVNAGYLDFGLNLLCSLLHRIPWTNNKLIDVHSPSRKGFAFVAMDKPAYASLRAAKLPVFKDPKIPFVSSKAAQWADPKFHSLVCTKLIPVIRLLEGGLNVVLSDADITYLHDPSPFFRRDVSMTFSIGSCHRELKDNTRVDGDNSKGKLNTGFYFAQATKGVIHLFKRALKGCSSSSLTGDQPAINAVLQDDRHQNKFHNPDAIIIKPQEKKRVNLDEEVGDALGGGGVDSVGQDYSYGFLDGCLFANGCVYFKHLCQNATYPPAPGTPKVKGGQGGPAPPGAPKDRSEAIMVHANFLVGKKTKIKHLLQYNLWDTQCMGEFRVAAGLDRVANDTTVVMAQLEEKAKKDKVKKRK